MKPTWKLYGDGVWRRGIWEIRNCGYELLRPWVVFRGGLRVQMRQGIRPGFWCFGSAEAAMKSLNKG